MSILAESIRWTQKDKESSAPTYYALAMAELMNIPNVIDVGWTHGEIHCIAEVKGRLLHCAYKDEGTHLSPLFQREVDSY